MIAPQKVVDTINSTIKTEGGYSNKASDRGGETIWGITLKTAREYGYTGEMKDMPVSTAFEIYLKRYWAEPGFDLIANINLKVAQELFDTGVNMGQGTASIFLQRCLNAFNKRGTLYPNLIIDGGIGGKTLSALTVYLKNRGADGELVLLRGLNGLQAAKYIGICESDETQEDYVFGQILNRVVI